MKKLLLMPVVSGLLCMPVWAAVETDLLGGSAGVRSESTLQTSSRVLWTLPFETTQYIPAQPTPTLREAIAAQEAGRFIEAISLLEQPGDEAVLPETQLLRASFYLQGNQTGQGREILSGLLQKHPQLAEAHALMSMALLKQGQIESAQSSIQRAQNLNNGELVIRISSYVLQAQSKLAEASDAMAALNAKEPADALNLAREAELALSLGDIQRASVQAMKAREIAPKSPYVMAVVGLVWLIEDKPVEAQGAFELALKRDPEDAKALLGLGLSMARQGKLDDSLLHLRKAAREEPSSSTIQTYLGRALHQTGKPQEAQVAYKTAIRLDPNDPQPWIYLAQAQSESGQPGAALESLKVASSHKAARAVYRGENLLNEDEQTLQANLAQTYRKLGMNDLAWYTLTEGVGEKNATSLKNQAEVLQGRQHAENARRSLSLQSLFNDSLDAMPVTLDIYGDGAGQTGAGTPQHGAVEGLSGQQPSYGDYGALFVSPNHLELDGVIGNRVTWGEQVRAAVGRGQFGISVAHRYYETEGFSSFNDLANTVWETVLKWNPTDSTRIFFSYRDFKSDRGEVFFPADIDTIDESKIHDDSWTGRLGLSQRLGNGVEIRALLSRQHVDQLVDHSGYYFDFFEEAYLGYAYTQPGKSQSGGREIQYRQKNRYGLFVGGLQSYHEKVEYPGVAENKINARRIYASQKVQLSEYLVLDAGLGRAWLENDDLLGAYDTELRRWTPHIGLVYSPSSQTHVHFAMGQDIGLSEVGNASLAPVETAGIVNIRPADLGKVVKNAGLGFDHRLGHDWLISGEAQVRKTFIPLIDYFTLEQVFGEYKNNDGELRLYWTPTGSIASSLSAKYEMRRNINGGFDLDSIRKQRLRGLKLAGSWFVDPTWTIKAEISRNWVNGQLDAVDWNLPEPGYLEKFSDASTQINASVQWKLPLGFIEVGVRNLLDSNFQYAESDPLAPLFSKGRLVFGSARMSF